MAASACSPSASRYISHAIPRPDLTIPLTPEPTPQRPRPYSRPAALRLKSRMQFNLVRELGRSYQGRYLKIAALDLRSASEMQTTDPRARQILQSAEASAESQLGIITGRRLGNAVLRSRCRRRIRELHRLHQHLLRTGFWIVVIPRRESATAAWSDLTTEWLRLLHRLSIVRKE